MLCEELEFFIFIGFKEPLSTLNNVEKTACCHVLQYKVSYTLHEISNLLILCVVEYTTIYVCDNPTSQLVSYHILNL